MSQGLPMAARPIMTPSQPVSAIMRRGVLGGADIAVADDGNGDGLFEAGDARPIGLAGISFLPGAGMQADAVDAFVLGHAGDVERAAEIVIPVPAHLDGKGNGSAARMARKISRQRSGSRRRAEPPQPAVTLRAGQPMLRSTTSAPRPSRMAADSPSSGIAAEELHAEEGLPALKVEDGEGLGIASDDAVGGDHLGIGEGTAALAAHGRGRHGR
jgi:hypothetical protein